MFRNDKMKTSQVRIVLPTMTKCYNSHGVHDNKYQELERGGDHHHSCHIPKNDWSPWCAWCCWPPQQSWPPPTSWPTPELWPPWCAQCCLPLSPSRPPPKLLPPPPPPRVNYDHHHNHDHHHQGEAHLDVHDVVGHRDPREQGDAPGKHGPSDPG